MGSGHQGGRHHRAVSRRARQAVGLYPPRREGDAAPAGGRDNGGPGLRADYGAYYHAGFVIDPDG
jgi:hypothetical protein